MRLDMVCQGQILSSVVHYSFCKIFCQIIMPKYRQFNEMKKQLILKSYLWILRHTNDISISWNRVTASVSW